MSECPGYYRDPQTGMPYCPHDHQTAPDDGESWETFCDRCRENQHRWAELAGDVERDEARDDG